MVSGVEEDITEEEVCGETEHVVMRENTEAWDVMVLSGKGVTTVIVEVGRDWTEDVEIMAGYG